MKTTLNIDDNVMRQLREEAARSGRTMSELVEGALRRMLDHSDVGAELADLPVFRSGGHLIDVADREALFTALDASS